MISHLAKCSFSILQIFLVLLIYTHQGNSQTNPAEGIREHTPTVHALTNVRIVQAPGKVIENGTLVIRDGTIESVGSVSSPADADVRDLKGMTLYPGLIDSYSDYGLPKAPEPDTDNPQRGEKKTPEPRGTGYWNSTVMADQHADELFSPDSKKAKKLRELGFTSALIVPTEGIFKGTSSLVNLGDGNANDEIVRAGVAQHIALERQRGRESYPGSLMGVIALIRQALLDAEWYQKAHTAFDKDPKLTRPEFNETLASLQDVITRKTPVIIEASDELNLLRANKLGEEFSLKLIIRGSGHEYKRLDAVKATRRSIILPINFPDVPSVQTPEEALQVSLTELRYWDEAPENPQRLQESGVPIALTTATLKDQEDFLTHLRTAVERGLSPDAALAALTITPARLFGVNNQLGSLEVGKVANFIVVDGDLFNKKTKIRESWIDGKKYDVNPIPEVDPRGKWFLTIADQPETDTLLLDLKGELDALKGTIAKKKETKLSNATYSDLRLSLSFTGDSLGYSGVVRMTANVATQSMMGNGEWSDGRTFTWSASRTAPFTPEPDTSKPKASEMASFPLVYPHGAFGRAALPELPDVVAVKNATIWTCGPEGRIENCDLIVKKGKTVAVGRNLKIPSDALVIDGTGKHVTPGLIDAHSHMAGIGGLNEAGQAISAEVRIGDVIDSDDISIYRALAGGLTIAHVLHGSANPIGGQCQLIKLRWGMLPEEMKFSGAPPTIKFALGENVKQSNWGDRYTTRYPQTRMGVEQIMRDEFRAALDYEKSWQKFEKEGSGIPPRRDLELDAILEILRGKRFIHCHSYRQDEILMLMRVAEDFGFRVQVFQHILEGYKVADIMAKHGVGGSSFSDWWAYKFEVYDAIPYNGALMYEQGVTVSFNSDSDELARRMNLEAAKAVKYGGVPEQEALKFVTSNPAKQLKVNDRVGSLEPGKDADFVLWSGSPLSTYSMCEQTWIDGRKFFDAKEAQELYEKTQQQRAVLIQKALASKKDKGKGESTKKPKRGSRADHTSLESNLEEGRQ